mgnify:CR=1 FL=1
MGFYQPAQLVQEARRSGVALLPPDVLHSDWDCTLEALATGTLAIRTGLRLVRSLAAATVVGPHDAKVNDARRAGKSNKGCS